MSTTFVSLSLEALKEDLVEYINDEPFDMLDEFEADVIADLVISIAERLMHRDFCSGHLIKRPRVDYLYKVNNKMNGFVSISDDDCTGVSRTEYKPFFHDDEDGYFSGLCSLASMINEAWYLCNN